MKRIFLFVFGLCFPLFGQNVVTVAQGGGGDYTTINDAIAAAASGDTIEVYAGDYAESMSLDKKLFLLGQEQGVTITCGSNPGIRFLSGSEGSMVRGFVINGTLNVYSFAPSDYIQILDNEIHGNIEGVTGKMFIAHNNFIAGKIVCMPLLQGYNGEDCVIFKNDLDGNGSAYRAIETRENFRVIANNVRNYYERGISINGVNNLVYANRISDSNFNLCFDGYATSGCAAGNNLISGGQHGIYINTGSNVCLAEISNNIIAGATVRAVYSASASSGSRFLFSGNIFYENTSGVVFNTPLIYEYNCAYNSGTFPDAGVNNILEDPAFTDSVTGDYTLQAGSPCIDTGSPNVQYLDLDLTRNDMGIYGGSHTWDNYQDSDPAVIDLQLSLIGNELQIRGTGAAK
ncbi:MAG: hypothetical protein P8184_09920 [Calditrichia bacterium]